MSDAPSLDALAADARAMLAAATPGPWSPCASSVIAEGVSAFEWEVSINGRAGFRHADAALIAAAPDLARGLVAAVDALRAEREARATAERERDAARRTCNATHERLSDVVCAIGCIGDGESPAHYADELRQHGEDEVADLVGALQTRFDATEARATAAEAQRDALAAAVRAALAIERGATADDAAARHAADEDETFGNAVRADAAADELEAARAATDALLSGAPADVVRAGVVRDLLARFVDGDIQCCDFIAQLAALAAAEGR